MSPTDFLIKKIERLPEAAQLQLWEYLDYLWYKFALPLDSELDPEFDSELLELLEARKTQLEAHPETAITVEAFKQRLAVKHGWDESNL